MSRDVKSPDLEMHVRELAEADYLGKRFTAPLNEAGPQVTAAYGEILARLAATSSAPVSLPFLIASPPTEGRFDVEVGIPCHPLPDPGPGLITGRLSAGRGATLIHHGPYEGIGEAYRRLRSWMAESDLHPAGPPREIYLTGPGDTDDPDDFQTEVVWPVS